MTTPPRRIDHLVLAVHDLDDAAAGYERIGFQVGARNRHPWGTENRLVQFGSSFLELITVGDASGIPPHRPGVFSFGAFVADYLAVREGLAMLVLDSVDAAGDAASFAEQGIGRFEPFFFERAGSAPDGAPTRVAFTLAFARDDRLPDAAFFVCQQHHPEAFWNPALQHHPNGARDVARVTLAVDDASSYAGFLEPFTGVRPDPGHGYTFANGGELRLVAAPDTQRFTGFTVAVAELDRVATDLERAGVRFDRSDHRIVLDAETGHGAEIRFEA